MKVWSRILFAAVLCLLPAQGARGDQLCEVTINCMPVWDADTLVLPPEAVLISPVFEHCSPVYFDESYRPGQEDTISVMFIIDHSNSMSLFDPTSARYRLTRQLIDSIYTYSPWSEVGIIVFSNQLLHNAALDPFYRQLYPDSGWTDSYAPLTNLSAEIDGSAATDRLKDAILLAENVPGADADLNQYQLVNGYYGPSGRITEHTKRNDGFNGTTDVSLAFEAARQAFTHASNPAHRQFIIFLSDGEAQYVDVPREPFINDYFTNVSGIPATFTAFWINRTQPIPVQIVEMTEALKQSDYSSANYRSTVWKTDDQDANLFTRLLDIVKGQLAGLITSQPVSLSVNSTPATGFDSLNAFFPHPFPLTGTYTTFSLSFTYHYGYPWNVDSTREFSVVVRRAAGAAWPQEIERECWDKGYLELYESDLKLDSILDSQQHLTVRLYPPQRYVPSSISLEITNAAGSDRLALTAANAGAWYEVSFTREFGSPKVDNILQTGFGDSVVVLFRNPLVALDTLRLALPVIPPRDIAVRRAWMMDMNANGYPDLIRVIQTGDRLTLDELAAIRPFVSFESERILTVVSLQPNPLGFDILLEEPVRLTAQDADTRVYPGEKLVIAPVPSLPGGGSFPAASIALEDSMAPVIVSAMYTDVAGPDTHDTLTVIFSEPVQPVSFSRPFLLSRWSENLDYTLHLRNVRTIDTVAVFTVLTSDTATRAAPGDSIRINPEAAIMDGGRVAQGNSANIARELQYLFLHRILSARWYDTSGDGLIDSIAIRTDRVPDAAMLAALYETLSLPAWRNLTYTAGDMQATDNGFSIRLSQPAATTPFTGTDPRDILAYTFTLSENNGVLEDGSIPIDDALAPVVTAAVYRPASVTEAGSTPPDTLQITFSEAIPRVDAPIPFLFTDSATGETYTMTLRALGEPDGAVQLFTVLSSEKVFPQSGDLVRINPVAGVGDAAGNIQDRESSGTTLSVREPVYTYSVFVSPNPFDFSSTAIPPDVQNALGLTQRTGQVLVVKPLAPPAEPQRIRTRLTIYDVVGNTMVSGQPLVWTPRGNAFVYVWDGSNRDGRLAGSGTYLARITVEDANATQVYQLKIGVSRR